jgi:hypothetical protein
MSLFDGASEQQVEANTSMLPPSASILTSSTRGSASQRSPIGQIENLRRPLIALLPCQEDMDYLSNTTGWHFLQRHIMPHLLGVPKHSEHDLKNPFDVLTVSSSHPIIITRLLLFVALSIQQLPPKIDLKRFQSKLPLREMMEKIIAFVATTVTFDDELIGSVEGIECLVLQAAYHVNAGNLRRAWLTFRRAINIAQLMGLQRVSLKVSKDMPDSKEARRHNLWYQILRGVKN